jgi:hypothetical protein
MGRKRVYSNAAERQKAYRERASTPLASPAAQAPKRRQPSRPAQLAAARNIICKVKTEYQRWLDRLPDFQEGSEQEERLTETVDSLEQVLDLLADIQPPKGYGRD